MTNAEIRQAILENGWRDKDPAEIAMLLNAPRTVLGSFYAGIGTPMKYLGAEAGAMLLETMTALAESSIIVKWGLKLLERGELDLGLETTRNMLDTLLPPESASILKGLAESQVSANVAVQQVIDSMEDI